MKYIVKNITAFYKKEKMIFLLITICIITSSFIINFSYGLYQNYHIRIIEAESEMYDLEVIFNNSKENYASKETLKYTLLRFSENLNKSIEMYLVCPECEEYADTGMNRIAIRFCIDKGNIIPCSVFEENLISFGTIVSGRYFTKEEEMNGDKVALISVDSESEKSFSDKIRIDNNTIMFQDNEYNIIGSQKIHPLIVPFESLNADTPINSVLFGFKKPFTISQYNEIKDTIESNFPGIAQIPAVDIPESDSYYLYNTIIIISILISLVAAINFAILYRYILSRRAKTIIIFRICGCTKLKVLSMFLAECLIIAIPLYTATAYIYNKFVLPLLGKNFEHIEGAYSFKLYLLIFILYIISTIVVLLLMMLFFLKKTLHEARRDINVV